MTSVIEFPAELVERYQLADDDVRAALVPQTTWQKIDLPPVTDNADLVADGLNSNISTHAELAGQQVTWGHIEACAGDYANLDDWREANPGWSQNSYVWFLLVSPTKRRSTAFEWDLPDGYRHHYSGKVREVFTTPTNDLLMITTDRISAYDWILPTQIPEKGAILTQLSTWWCDRLADVVPSHIISTQVPPSVAGRAVVTRKLQMYPVECVVRGYLAGSGYTDYQESGAVCGIKLPPGLADGSRLPLPIFTPATKAEIGDHDENISLTQVVDMLGANTTETLRSLSLAAYQLGEAHAANHGVILADTKFEFGHDGQDGFVLADEALTPDSSRYWPADDWQPGRPQPSYDKQYVRDWLTSPESGWDKSSGNPPPSLPPAVVAATRERYVEAYQLITGNRW